MEQTSLQILAQQFEAAANPRQAFSAAEYSQLIPHYLAEGMIHKALEVAEQARVHFPAHTGLLLLHARVLIELRDGDSSLELLNELPVGEEDRVPYLILKAKALCLAGAAESAVLELEAETWNLEARAKSQLLTEIALIRYQLKDHSGMYEALREAIQADPSQEEAVEKMWIATELTRRQKESLRLYDWLLREQPYSKYAWYNKGHAHYYLNQYEEAIASFEYAFLIDPKMELAYRFCAEVCMETGQFTKALRCFNDMLEFRQPDAEILLQIGKCYEHNEQYDQAMKCYQLSRKQEPLSAETFFRMGAVYRKQGNLLDACRYMERAVALEATNEDYQSEFAAVLARMGYHNRAEQVYRQAVDTAPELPDQWVKFAHYLIEQEKYREAITLLEESDEYTCGPEILYVRAACHFYTGERKVALNFLGEALQDDYEMRNVLFLYKPSLAEDKDVISIFRYYREM